MGERQAERPVIFIDPQKARDLDRDLALQEIYYRPEGSVIIGRDTGHGTWDGTGRDSPGHVSNFLCSGHIWDNI